MSVGKNYLGDTSSKSTDKVSIFQSTADTRGNMDMFFFFVCTKMSLFDQEYDLWATNIMQPDWKILNIFKSKTFLTIMNGSINLQNQIKLVCLLQNTEQFLNPILVQSHLNRLLHRKSALVGSSLTAG